MFVSNAIPMVKIQEFDQTPQRQEGRVAASHDETRPKAQVDAVHANLQNIKGDRTCTVVMEAA